MFVKSSFHFLLLSYYRVFGKILRRGDHTKVSMDSNDSSEYSVMVFVNEFWKKNYYGELYLYVYFTVNVLKAVSKAFCSCLKFVLAIYYNTINNFCIKLELQRFDVLEIIFCQNYFISC